MSIQWQTRRPGRDTAPVLLALLTVLLLGVPVSALAESPEEHGRAFCTSFVEVIELNRDSCTAMGAGLSELVKRERPFLESQGWVLQEPETEQYCRDALEQVAGSLVSCIDGDDNVVDALDELARRALVSEPKAPAKPKKKKTKRGRKKKKRKISRRILKSGQEFCDSFAAAIKDNADSCPAMGTALVSTVSASSEFLREHGNELELEPLADYCGDRVVPLRRALGRCSNNAEVVHALEGLAHKGVFPSSQPVEKPTDGGSE